jgi:hypothetical protein
MDKSAPPEARPSFEPETQPCEAQNVVMVPAIPAHWRSRNRQHSSCACEKPIVTETLQNTLCLLLALHGRVWLSLN